MVLTRSSYKKACESCDSSSDLLSKPEKEKHVAPPWCSLAKVYDGKKSRKVVTPTWQTQSSYPVRENIWEYLYEDKRKLHKRKKCKGCSKQTPPKNKSRRTFLIYLSLLFSAFGAITYLWIFHGITETSLIAALPQTTTLLSLLGLEQTAVEEECCSRMKHLAEALLRAEQALRSTLRLRRMMLTSTAKTLPQDKDRGFIHGVSVTRGSDTTEFGGRVALWGVVPLWRAAPSPDIVLALRRPRPADCWPFSGSTGELILELPAARRFRAVSVEHVRPDTALSAPKHFVLYGILPNGTWLRTVENEYRLIGPAKQYFHSQYQNVPLQKLVFRVTSNHGNKKYTCIYRIHLYESAVDEFFAPQKL